MSVRENLEFPLKRNFELPQSEMDERVYKVLDAVSLEEAIDGGSKDIVLSRKLYWTFCRLINMNTGFKWKGYSLKYRCARIRYEL